MGGGGAAAAPATAWGRGAGGGGAPENKDGVRGFQTLVRAEVETGPCYLLSVLFIHPFSHASISPSS